MGGGGELMTSFCLFVKKQFFTRLKTGKDVLRRVPLLDMASGHFVGKLCKPTVDCETVSFFLEIGFSRFSHEARKPNMPVFMFMYMHQWLLAYSIYWWKDKMGNLNKKVLITVFIETETKYKLHNRYGQK